MKYLAFLSLIASATAHYIFGAISVDGVQSRGAVRQIEPSIYTRPVLLRFEAGDERFVQCNDKDRLQIANDVVTISPGQKLGFHITYSQGLPGMFHPGPGAMYISKVPKGVDIRTWYGEGGEWIKIDEWGVKSFHPIEFILQNAEEIVTTLPNVPSGQYLVRAEHIAIHDITYPQGYIACGQIDVVNGNGTLPKGVPIPGYITGEEPAFRIDVNDDTISSYEMPPPAVWRGE